MSDLPVAEAQRLLTLDEQLRAEADCMLDESGLGPVIKEAGYQPVGSYVMRTMTWRDLDFERFQDPPSWQDHWVLGLQLSGTGWPWRQVCVDAYRDPRTPGEKGLYWGLRVAPPDGGETWKLDLWTARAEEFHREGRERWQAAMTEDHRLHILAIKEAVCSRPEYRDTMLSVHVYEAVIDHGIRGLEAFMEWWRGREDEDA
ncbi:MAG: hypothetical protein JXA57_20135 [Armatimonadetes bacterium]|nr:hypothetical protein [Armatimonadota bacterium]